MSALQTGPQTVILFGRGGIASQACVKVLGEQGANVVVNTLETSHMGDLDRYEITGKLLNEVESCGGKGLADNHTADDLSLTMDMAVKLFGSIDVVIYNVELARQDGGNVFNAQGLNCHLKNAYKCIQAVWSHQRRQKHGKVIMTCSMFDGTDNSEHILYNTISHFQIGFMKSLAKEGLKYDINCSAVKMNDSANTSAFASLISLLAHPHTTTNTGPVFEIKGDKIHELKWQRARGALFRLDETFTATSVSARWKSVIDYSTPDYPSGPIDFTSVLEDASKVSENLSADPLDFGGKVALVTGAGTGLGRIYALSLARLGASVVVNDVMDPDSVVREIQSHGGIAVANRSSVEDGKSCIASAIDAFGRIDIVINNTGILRDKAFHNMNEADWTKVFAVHLEGSLNVTQATWPYFKKQKYGRVINTTSHSGMYGNFGQTNYGAAKLAIVGLSQTLAQQGKKHNILVNTISPVAGTNMSKNTTSESLTRLMKPDYIAPLVLLLSSSQVPEPFTGCLYEVGCGWIGQARWHSSVDHEFRRHDQEETTHNSSTAFADPVKVKSIGHGQVSTTARESTTSGADDKFSQKSSEPKL